MEASKTDLLSLLKAIEVLAPYLDEIVIVGGWVPFLYRRYGQMPSRHPSLRTMDIDVVVPRHVEERGRPTIDELLSSAFIYQKGLTLSRRHSKVSKDLYYIFNLLDSSKELRDSIPVEINSLQSQYAARWFRSFIRNLNKYFPESGAEGPALVATQYSGPMPVETFRNYAYRTFRDFIQALREIAAR